MSKAGNFLYERVSGCNVSEFGRLDWQMGRGASQIARLVVHCTRTTLALSSGASNRQFALYRRSCSRRRWGLCMESSRITWQRTAQQVGEAQDPEETCLTTTR